jgi:hypothetical protein
MSLTATESTLELPTASKAVLLLNDGANPCWVRFDKAVVADEPGVKVLAGERMEWLRVQAQVVHAICDTAQTTTLRVVVLI